MSNTAIADEVLRFWFGTETPGLHYIKSQSGLWFRDGKSWDKTIIQRFGELHQQASEHKLDDWQQHPLTSLALIILLDQFSRHIYRETPRAFAQDKYAQACTLKGMQKGFDLQLPPSQRIFYYMPLEHAEDRDLQAQSVAAFTALVESLPEEIRPEYVSTLNFAIRHKEVIDRFGRFPDLNAILGRKSTAAEIEFLSQPGSSFL